MHGFLAVLAVIAAVLSLLHSGGWGPRSLETFPSFAAGVLSAKALGASTGWTNGLSIFFVASRAVYVGVYIVHTHKALAAVRTVVFALGMMAVVGLYIAALAA